jgi:ureidoglycolate amidohydrolase
VVPSDATRCGVVRCRNGWSHRPDEFSSDKDIGNGVATLALTLAKLSGGSFPAASREEL